MSGFRPAHAVGAEGRRDPQSGPVRLDDRIDHVRQADDAGPGREFQELWKRINVKTFYKVDFKTSDLIGKAIEAIDKRLTVTKIRMVVEQGAMNKIESKEALLQGTAMEERIRNSASR